MATWNDGPGVITLPSGRRIRGRSWRVAVEEQADISIVLTTSVGNRFGASTVRSHAGQTITIDWPDYRLPRRPAQALQTLREAWNDAVDRKIEITCAGGVGRTGTALAILAVFDGMDPHDAIDFIQREYNPESVASPAQRAFVMDLGSDVN
ncbi:protein-tyrosine phosphatase family protein [Arcanobacterium buesumense]|uniref:Protein phosphatase n=1 Tax=Arcanobacterium buesumense TaxID=2722751 RepID=A0A6H2EMR7_9ACTO|nr:protein-tyrosine phosphatase family protein [Arcanobacterium buesumense]QJC22366.1 protein phosphatase [Arcanobacterium buesumense]